MQKSIYICLITLFCSLSAFAGPYDEYGYNNSSFGSPMYNTGAMGGGTYWSSMASTFYAQSNPVTPYSYSQTIETKVKTSESYTVSSTQPASSPNTIVVKYVSPSTGWDMWKIYPATTITSTQEKTVSPLEANTAVLNQYGPNTYYNFNIYNPVQQNYTYNTYQAAVNGPVLVASAVQSGPPPVSAPYTAIPRSVSTGSLDASPGSKFQIGVQLYNQQTLTLDEASKAITDFIDRVIPDAPNGRIQFIGNVISKVASGLPADQNGQAANLLATYMKAIVKYPNMTKEQFENWFMGKSEGIDGDYDAAYWEDPNLTFPQQSLPSTNDFKNAYPKNSNGTFEMNYADVYSLVGGTPKGMRDGVLTDTDPLNDHNYDNACALRTSRALNYSGIIIPYIKNQTFKGSDNKYYFLGARNLYNWMVKTFPPNSTNSIVLHQSDGGPNGANFPSLLGSNQGIYILIPKDSSNSGFAASGHAGIYTTPELTHYYFGATGGVESITLWKLN
ncbi:MAG: T6SS effector amidase Tae4 family protein [Flavobacterium sp.]